MTEAELVQRWIGTADEVALTFAHEPDGKVDAELARMRQRIIDNFLALFPSVPPETMAAGVDSIVAEIQKRRREIETAGRVAEFSRGTESICLMLSVTVISGCVRLVVAFVENKNKSVVTGTFINLPYLAFVQCRTHDNWRRP
jgi:hypothetical protein